MKAPDHQYLHDVIDAWFVTRNLGVVLSLEKSRRLWVSWLLCALDVWDAGRRSVVVVQGGATYDKASDFVYRCWYIYDQIRRRNKDWDLPVSNTWGNTDTKRLDRVAFATGSVFEPLNSDGEAFRGSGYARVKLEELSNYRYPDAVLSQAKLVTMGPPTKPGEPKIPGGHVVAVSNASANDDWQKIKAYPEGYVPPEPYAVYTSKAGIHCLRISYKCDPLKDQAWEIAERSGGGISERKWRLEMGLDDSVHDGTPVFENFVERIHSPIILRRAPWELTPGSTYIMGMDAGDSLWPAAILLEVGPAPWHQLAFVYEWTFLGNTTMYKAIPKILNGGEWDSREFLGLRQILPGSWLDVEWHGDHTIIKRQAAFGHTAQMAAIEHGIQIKPVSNILDARLSAMDWALDDMLDPTTPRMFVSGYGCPMLLKGFQGAYKTMDIPNKPTGSDRRMPDKNVYSHVADGAQYAMVVAKDIVQGKRAPTKKRKPRRR